MKGQKTVVTGGTSGIGRSVVFELLREGAEVVFCGTNIERGEHVLKEAKSFSGKVKFYKCDVSNSEDVANFFKKAVGFLGDITSAFNNAGIEGEVASFNESTEENWDQVLQINLKGIWYAMKQEIPIMLKRGEGAIVNMASTSGLVGNGFGMTAYAASKFGVVGLSKSVALEYAKQGIRVNAICPGFVDTPMIDSICEENSKLKRRFIATHPIGRMGQPEEIAKAVVYMLSPQTSFMTGTAFVMDGGLTI